MRTSTYLHKLFVSIVFLFSSASFLIAQPTLIKADRILEGLEKPIDMHWEPDATNDSKFYLQFHSGKIVIYENGVALPTPFIDLGPDGLNIVDYGNSSEQGMNGFAFDPDYTNNGFIYVNYNGVRPDSTGHHMEQRLICFKRDEDNPNTVDTDEWYELLEFDEGDDPENGHNGGQIHFGPDGYMYVSCGDGGGTGNGVPGGGSGGDDHGEIGNGQNLETFLGKILRIDAHGMDPYTIPEDNPFVDDESAYDEIWAYGLRNPWRYSFDRVTGDMWIGDVGEVDWEEVNFQPANSLGGENYGWRLLEADMCYEPTVDCDPDGETILPVLQYPHLNGWCATVCGYTYRGSNIPSMYGYTIVGDFCGFNGDKFWLIAGEGENFSNSIVEIDVPGGFIPWEERVYGFAEEPTGELYLITSSAVYKLQSDPDSPVSTEDAVFMYPNPAYDEITVVHKSQKLITHYEVWDSFGRIVDDAELTEETHVLKLNVTNLASGNYVLKVYYGDEGASSIQKMVVANHD